MNLLKSVEQEQQKTTKPSIKVGNNVKVHVRIKEGNRERIQIFEGTVIKIQGGGVNQTFTVRKISYGVGVERTFLVNSPLLEKVETVRQGIVRRAKLFYLRDRVGKATKVKEKIFVKSDKKNVEVVEEVAPIKEVVEAPVQEEVIETPVEETVVNQEPVTEETKTEEVEVKEEAVVEEDKKEETTTNEQ